MNNVFKGFDSALILVSSVFVVLSFRLCVDRHC